jgi:basic membrane protein A
MQKKLWTAISVLLILGMVLAGCAPAATPTPTPRPKPTEPPPPPPSLTGTVTLWHAWKEAEIPALVDVIAAFNAENPDVVFDVLYVPFDDLRGKYETAAGTGEGPTVLIGASDWGPAFYDAELVADVSGMASSEFLGTINEAALGAVRYRGALIGLPQTIKGVVMYRNKEIIPEAPATFDDLISAAQAATAGDVVGADLEFGFFFSAAHLDGIGGKLMESNGDPAFNDAKGVEWLELGKSWQEAGLPGEYYTDNDVNLFNAGLAGIIIDGTWNLTSLAGNIGAENLAVDPWPTYGDGHLSGYVQTENIYLNFNAEGDDKAAGWAFMEFFMSPEAQALLTGAGHIPATLGVECEDPLLQQATEAFELGTAFPVIPEMGAYWESMDTALKSVFDEGVDPADALQQAYDSITAKIAEIRGVAPPTAAISVGQVTDMGGIDDASFNQTAWEGILRAVDELGADGKFIESQEQADYAKNIQQFLDEELDLIVTVGFLLGVDTATAAIANPEQKFAIVDYAYPDCAPGAEVGKDCGSDTELPNVLGLIYATDEAAFLAGYLAAGMSQTGKVGTFGGIKIPPVTIFMQGFEAGVMYYNMLNDTSVEVLGWDSAADEGLFTGNFESLDDGRRFAESLMDEGADIILPVAGPVGLGSAAACEERGTMLVGVDTDWYFSAPEYAPIYLTSILKNMDVSVFDAAKAVATGTFAGGVYVGTLENNGVGIAPFHDFADDVPADLVAELEQLTADIIAGTITVAGVLGL